MSESQRAAASSNVTQATPQPKRARVLGVDGLRAFAALWIMIAHGHMTLGDPYRGTWLGDVFANGMLGVGIFYILSGMLLASPFWRAYDEGRSLPSLRVYAKKRLARLVPGYFLVLIVCFLTFHPWTVGQLLELAPAFLLVNSFHWRTFFPVRVNLPLWTVPLFVHLYVLLALWMVLLFRLRGRFSGVALLLVSIVACVSANTLLVTAIGDLHNYGFEVPEQRKYQWALGALPIKNALALFPIMLVGVLGAYVFRRISQRRLAGPNPGSYASIKYDVIAFIIALVAVNMVTPTVQFDVRATLDRLPVAWRLAPFWTEQTFGIMQYGWPWFPLLMVMLAISLSFSRYIGAALNTRFLVFTSEISFGLYMWHMPVFYLVARAWPNVADMAWPMHIVYFLICSAITYVIAMASFHIVERPFNNWAHQRPAQPPQQPATEPTIGRHA